MRLALVISLLAAGCDSPAPRFAAAPVTRVEVAGHSFSVYAREGEAQVIRTNRSWLPDAAEVQAAGILAAEMATGCAVHRGRISGDAAIITLGLSC